jgi:release factor glutamine methyltransferase
MRAAWRVVQRLRFRLWQHRRHDRLVLERGLGFPLVVLPDVFNPTLFFTTAIVIRHLADDPLPAGCSVLDLGTGSGALAVAAARTAGRVVAVDVNPEAVRCTRINLLLNHVEDLVEARRGDLFDAVTDERFDLVLCNPPYFRGQPGSELERAFRSEGFAERFASELPWHLAADGCALVVLSSDGDEAGFLAAFEASELVVREVSRASRFGERIHIYRVSGNAGALPDLR